MKTATVSRMIGWTSVCFQHLAWYEYLTESLCNSEIFPKWDQKSAPLPWTATSRTAQCANDHQTWAQHGTMCCNFLSRNSVFWEIEFFCHNCSHTHKTFCNSALFYGVRSPPDLSEMSFNLSNMGDTAQRCWNPVCRVSCPPRQKTEFSKGSGAPLEVSRVGQKPGWIAAVADCVLIPRV